MMSELIFLQHITHSMDGKPDDSSSTLVFFDHSFPESSPLLSAAFHAPVGLLFGRFHRPRGGPFRLAATPPGAGRGAGGDRTFCRGKFGSGGPGLCCRRPPGRGSGRQAAAVLQKVHGFQAVAVSPLFSL
jgi:hypothetical protein